MDDAWPQSRTYVILSSLNWLLFLGGVFLLTWIEARGAPDYQLWALVLLLAGTVAAQFVAGYRLVAEQDEFIRGITIKRGIAAAGLTLCVAVFWGLAEQFLGVPQVPTWVLYPFFWGSFGIVTPLIRSSHA
jgi:hypothetical protein